VSVCLRLNRVVKKIVMASHPKQVSILLATLLLLCVSGALAQAGPDQYLPRNIKNLKDKNPRVRYGAASNLWSMGSEAKTALQPLIEALGDKDADVRGMAGMAIGVIGADPVLAVPPLLQLLNTEQEKSVREKVAEALGNIGPGAASAIPDLVQMLKVEKMPHAAAALGKIKRDPQVCVPALVAGLTDTSLREPAATALVEFGPDAKIAIPHLITNLKNADSYVRYYSAAVLQSIGPEAKEAAPALKLALQDEDVQVRTTAACALGHIGQDRDPALPVLLHAVYDEDLRGDVIRCIGEFGVDGEKAIPILIKLLNDDDAHVSRGAAFSLERIAKALQEAGRTDTVDQLKAVEAAMEQNADLPVKERALNVEDSITALEAKRPTNGSAPVVRILAPLTGSPVSSTSLTLHYTVETSNDSPVTAVRVTVDGRAVAANRGVQLISPEGQEQTVIVDIPPQDCDVSLVVENRSGASAPATVHLTWAGAQPSGELLKPSLYALAIGISAYASPALRLSYAAKDAKDFAAALQTQKGRLYRDVQVKLLPDARKDDILDGLDWLQQQVTSRDMGIIFLAGHGVDDSNGLYYFLPADVDLDHLKRTGVAFSDIKNTAASIAGKAVMFVDTCHSGDVMGGRRGSTDMNAVIQELASAENGLVVFAASTGRQYSLEDPQWKNGAFTKALVEGLTGKAASAGGGKVTVNMLDVYISERVKELTEGRQTPATAKPNTVPDFPIAVTQ